jgi:hypothetical protein
MTPTVCVFNRTRESFLCLCAVATGVSLVPALGFPGLGPGSKKGFRITREDGIWLKPSGVYDVGTLIPADRVYLDRGNRVIQLVEHLDPLQIVRVRCPYASVLEVRTRTIFSSRTRVGDELLICPADEVETRWKQIQTQVPRAWTEQEVIPCLNG